MPIEIAVTPALVSNASVSSVSTASFTRPEGGLLVAMVVALSSTTYTLSGGSLTWTKQVSNTADIWTAPVTGSGSMTVTVGNLTDPDLANSVAALKVVGVTGQNLLNPIGNSGSGESATNNLTASGYTSSVAGSRGFFCGIDSNATGAATSTDTGSGWTQNAGFFDVGGVAVHKAANTTNAGTSVTFNADAAGSGTAAWEWVALEIVPDVVVRQRTFVSRAAVHRAASW